MKKTFLLSKDLHTDDFSHIISLNPIAIFNLPDYVQISGHSDNVLRNRVIEWHQGHNENVVHAPRQIPKGFQESMEMVRKQRDFIDLKDLAHQIGISLKILTLCINGESFRGHPVTLTFRMKVRFMELVRNLEYNFNQQIDEETDNPNT